MWDGYQAARDRVFDFLANERMRDVAILTGDIHSSWALDVPRNPVEAAIRPATGEGLAGGGAGGAGHQLAAALRRSRPCASARRCCARSCRT